MRQTITPPLIRLECETLAPDGVTMARRNNKKGRQRRRTKRFSLGPMNVVQSGRVATWESRMDKADHATMRVEMAASLPLLTSHINEVIRRLAECVPSIDPKTLLHCAWTRLMMASIRIKGSKGDKDAQGEQLRALDYLQCLVCGLPPGATTHAITEAEWDTVSKDIDELYTTLNIPYQLSTSASRQATDPDYDVAVDEIRFRLETNWVNVVGQRYHVHEKVALLDLLAPHTDTLQRLFGIDATTLINGLDGLLTNSTRGTHDAMRDLRVVQGRTLQRAQEIARERGESPGDADLRGASLSPDIAEELKRVFGALYGLDLFDVKRVTGLPDQLIDELTWSPGQDTDFMAPGDFAGWPLRVRPTMKRPFVRLGDSIYCFNVFALFDHAYRVIQRAVLRLAPDYREEWNRKQKEVSESLPRHYLARLLPGAQIHSSVYYQGRGASGKLEWCETDALVVLDDHLLIVEVKAGAFTYTSPATDLEAHIASIRNLIQAPAEQGQRFLRYLNGADDVPLFDEAHREVARLQRSQFRRVTPCAVTLDSITALAARAHHLAPVGVGTTPTPTWSLSIDDLRVFAEVFTNPLQFLHFAEQRLNAAGSGNVELYDEMEHLGAYLTENNYRRYSDSLSRTRDDKVVFSGYSEPIDHYL